MICRMASRLCCGAGPTARCVFFEPRRGNLCAIQRQMDHSHLPSACRHFPRVAVIDPRGTFVTLSHVCPTAARMLIDGGDCRCGDVRGPSPIRMPRRVGRPRCARRVAAAGPARFALGLGRLGSLGAIGAVRCSRATGNRPSRSMAGCARRRVRSPPGDPMPKAADRCRACRLRARRRGRRRTARRSDSPL